MRPANIKRMTADGDVCTIDSYLRSVVFMGGSATSTLVVRAGGAAGTVVLSMSALANTTETVYLGDAFCKGGIYVAMTGTGMVASLTYV